MSKRKIRKNNCQRTCVELNEKEFKKLKSDAEMRGMYTGKLLKESYFGERPQEVNMSWKDMKLVLRESITPMWRNLCQIVSKYRKSFHYGWNDEPINNLIEEYCKVYNFVTKGHLPPKKPFKV